MPEELRIRNGADNDKESGLRYWVYRCVRAGSRDSTPVSHICVRFGSGRLGPCPVPDAGHCGMLGAMR